MPATTPDRLEARLALENAVVFRGWGFGACDTPHTVTGEVVFNTAMTGYQEALTDPSYAGQILTMTAPQIGNYGVTPEDMESGGPQVAGFVIRELARRYSNHRAAGDLSGWLAAGGVLGLEGIDTRALVRIVRAEGALRGAITCDTALDDAALVEMARASERMAGRNLAAAVSPSARRDLDASCETGGDGDRLRVLALDCGAKRNMYRHLTARGCLVHVAPHDLSAREILDHRPDGLFVSNGPGDPAAVGRTIETLKEVAGRVPTMGICLGHQLLALALGARTYKLKFGHRGANQPVRNLLTSRVEITSQNHGFCVDGESLEALDCRITHVHLNDGTVAGFRHATLPIFSVQFHPEASPGPHDSVYLFDCFVAMMRTGGPITAEQMQEAGGRGSRLSAVGSQPEQGAPNRPNG